MPSLQSKGTEKEEALKGETGLRHTVVQWLVNQLISQGRSGDQRWMIGGFSEAVEGKKKQGK